MSTQLKAFIAPHRINGTARATSHILQPVGDRSIQVPSIRALSFSCDSSPPRFVANTDCIEQVEADSASSAETPSPETCFGIPPWSATLLVRAETLVRSVPFATQFSSRFAFPTDTIMLSPNQQDTNLVPEPAEARELEDKRRRK